MPPTFCPCNKPILKRPSAHSPAVPAHDDLLHIDPSVLGQPTVRFPPTPALVTRTFLAHPAAEYDRSPIVVAPNACKLPERGCPGRTYLPSTTAAASQSTTLHSSGTRERQRGRARSPTTRRTHAQGGPALPPLVPDLTSSSSDDDDSDRLPRSSLSIDAYTTNIKSKHTLDDSNTASDEVDRAFLRFRSSHLIDDALSIPIAPPSTLIAPSPSPAHSSTLPRSHTTLPSPSLTLTLSDSPPPVPSPLSNPTSPVSFNMRAASSSNIVNGSTSGSTGVARASRWERAVRRNGSSSSSNGGGSRERSKRTGSRTRRSEKEKEGFKRFGDFEGRSVLTGCALTVDDGGCFGGF